jgi:hypothetical protein
VGLGLEAGTPSSQHPSHHLRSVDPARTNIDRHRQIIFVRGVHKATQYLIDDLHSATDNRRGMAVMIERRSISRLPNKRSAMRRPSVLARDGARLVSRLLRFPGGRRSWTRMHWRPRASLWAPPERSAYLSSHHYDTDAVGLFQSPRRALLIPVHTHTFHESCTELSTAGCTVVCHGPRNATAQYNHTSAIVWELLSEKSIRSCYPGETHFSMHRFTLDVGTWTIAQDDPRPPGAR